MVRAANTGISAVIDPYGRILSRLSEGEGGIIDSKLPQSLAPTIFARLGELLFAVAGFLVLAAGFVLHRNL